MKTALGLLGSALLTLGAAGFAQAAELSNCADRGIDLTTVVAPAAQNSRSFANNSISVFNIDTEEPAAASAGIAIVIPDTQSEVGGAKCFALTGFSQIDVMKAKSTYDSERGLLLTIPNFLNVDGSSSVAGPDVKIRINLQKATVTLQQ